ncbi:ABC transporter substrate-binding protein [Catelliglobosispora koreensis]|uniref:ABC transporter substrate-binding protein n=1 Tax=Catelliglobosispora koreensis TaxID=129052 RepID=UPI0003A4789E|nr:ABC transporter substrate-binding protein [Catelliglobosispora koreensis]
MRHPSRIAAAALLAVSLAACNSPTDTAPAIQTGGTLRVVLNALPSDLDPQRITQAVDANVSRLITRTLTTFKTESGKASGDIVPDLANDLGRASENNTMWEFQLRPGIKWADGSPITCAQLKYGAERNFASFAAGLPYARSYLKDNEPAYQGPFIGGNTEGLKSVTCPDTKTIRYQLKHPVGDFNYAVALPIFAPVKPGADSDKDAFNRAPLTSGPYKIKSRSDTEMVFVRNEHWSATVDKVRRAFPDEIVLKADRNVPAVTNALIENQGDNQNTIMLSQDVAPNFVQQVMTDPALLSRTASGPMGAVRYMALNAKLVPEKCRQALAFAFNKRKFRQAMGGSLLGDLATTVLPPTLQAYQPFDFYNTAITNGDGDLKRAQELLNQAKTDGVTCPAELIVAHPDVAATTNRYMKTMVEPYLELGIKLTFRPIPPGDYYNLLKRYDQQTKLHMAYVGWIPDWANGSAVLPALFKSTEVATQAAPIGGSNYSYLQDPEIDGMIDEAMLENNIERQWAHWAEIDKRLQQKATTIPIIYSQAIRLHGSNVAGAFIHSAFGMPDLASMGLLSTAGSPS